MEILAKVDGMAIKRVPSHICFSQIPIPTEQEFLGKPGLDVHQPNLPLNKLWSHR
jgi:hypothetical protein